MDWWQLRCHIIGNARSLAWALDRNGDCSMATVRPTTEIGFTNRNGQVVIRSTGQPGTDHMQYVYVLRCGNCGAEYGANGSDIFQRRCPKCQRGAPGLAY